MALSLYLPDKAAFRTWTPPALMDTDQLLLLNILIELKIATHYLQMSASQPTDEVTGIRNDVVNAPPY